MNPHWPCITCQHTHTLALAGSLILAGITAELRSAGPCNISETAALRAPGGSVDDMFGVAVALDGDLAVIGAKAETVHDSRSGAAHVFRFREGAWRFEATLAPADAAPEDLFGQCVALDKNVAVIGALWDDDRGSASGSAYVFRFDGESWIAEQKLLPSDGSAIDEFGNAVAIHGDAIVVGAFLDDDHGGQSGSVYVFTWDGHRWNEEQKLTAPDGESADRFGYSVDFSQDVLVIGADLDDDRGMDAGSAYVFRQRDGAWQPEQKLLADDGAEADRFGTVAIDGQTIAVGARYADTAAGADTGAVYIYSFDGSKWQQQDKLVPQSLAPLDWFGYSVALDEGLLAVGAWQFQLGRPGAAHLFGREENAWKERFHFALSDPEADAHFGASVSVDTGRCLVGAPRASGSGARTGQTYVFQGFDITDCNDNCTDDAADIAGGTSTDANDNGIPDECESDEGMRE